MNEKLIAWRLRTLQFLEQNIIMIWMSFANRNSVPVNLKLLQVEKKVTKFYQVKEQFLCKYFYKDWF